LGILGLLLIHTKWKFKNTLIGGLLGLLWLWIGIAYHFSPQSIRGHMLLAAIVADVYLIRGNKKVSNKDE